MNKEVRTEKINLLIGVLKQNMDGKIYLEAKNGKRTDYIMLDDLQKIISQCLEEEKSICA